jgi:phenylpyruvate tautomerase PptA (4-oxalocrotonate tautomerase family)
MPTYHVTTADGLLDVAQRAALARAITAVHADATGAPGVFAQVIFANADTESVYIGGEPAPTDQVYVQVILRAGRTETVISDLFERLTSAIAGIAGIVRRSVWINLVELPPNRMLEFGRVLPAPGLEAAWLARLDEDAR